MAAPDYDVTSPVRCRGLAHASIERLGVRLDGLTLLTEAGSRFYALTPLIGALAGAKKVMIVTGDSPYGKAADIRENVMGLANAWGVSDRISFLEGKHALEVENADVVTNLGFLRPLDRNFLSRLRETVAIPLMWETWEFREADLDLSYCRERGIPVLGTDEHVPQLQIIRYVGMIAVKALLQSDIEVQRSRILVLGSGEFLEESVRSIRGADGDVTPFPVSGTGHFDVDGLIAAARDADALVVVEHYARALLIGPGAALEARTLHEANPALVVVHVCGGADRDSLASAGLSCFPARFRPAGYMSLATDYVGPRPLIDLHTAGLGVGAALARYRQRGFSAAAAESAVLAEIPYAQGFHGAHARPDREGHGS